MAKVFDSFFDSIQDEFTSIASDGEGSAEFSSFIDTGCYALNALLSGSLYGGLPDNKISAFAGESATGKTFFVLGIVRNFLAKDPEARVIYYDTEAAVTKAMMEDRGIDPSRVIISEPETIQKFRTHAIKVLDTYAEMAEGKRFPMLMVLDSLGMLSTSKELEDSTDGKDTRDMTRAPTIRAAFRILTLKTAKVGVPLIITNHTYDGIGMFATKEIAGGGGLKYAASTIVMLGKSKDKDGTDVVGSIIRAKTYKSRISKENAEVKLLLSYKNGLDRYYGLLDLAEKYGIVKKVSTKYDWPNGVSAKESQIKKNPEKYFDKEIMERLEDAAGREFKYGTGPTELHDVDEDDTVDA